MSYAKKVAVLSQTAEGFSPIGKRVSAICRIEKEDDNFTVYLSVVNCVAVDEGKYILFIMDKSRRLFSFSLGRRPTSLTKSFDFPEDLTQGFAAGISYVKNDIPVLVAFSRTEGFNEEKFDFKKAMNAKFMQGIKKEKAPPVKEPEDPPLPVYDDEAVATENYFEADEDLEQKLKIIESMENVRNENVPSDFRRKEKTEKSAANDNGYEYEKHLKDRRKYSEEHPYFNSARTEIENIFFKFPEEEGLKKVIPESRWAKINYSADKYYVVGVIYDGEKEKYLCYGVPSVYSPTPPKEFKGCCSFVPLSVFDLKGKGYWIMFQSAVTGECVKPT